MEFVSRVNPLFLPLREKFPKKSLCATLHPPINTHAKLQLSTTSNCALSVSQSVTFSRPSKKIRSTKYVVVTGWVRIERIDGVGAAQRGFWHVVRSTLGAAQVAGGERGPVRRPRCLSAGPCASPPFADMYVQNYTLIISWDNLHMAI